MTSGVSYKILEGEDNFELRRGAMSEDKRLSAVVMYVNWYFNSVVPHHLLDADEIVTCHHNF
jgi:hypothetical protein